MAKLDMNFFGLKIKHPVLKALALALSGIFVFGLFIVFPTFLLGGTKAMLCLAALVAVHCGLRLSGRQGFYRYQKNADGVSVKIGFVDSLEKLQ
ncbi:hypothetical protein HYT45_04045 [Candidatus Uhrbacteria bacterium]|nr:hypothetical protein [Candidatus Uhrbacteria bacterium]